MEVDDGVAAGTSWKEGQDKLLVKDDRYTVHERKGLPVELHDVILAAGKWMSLWLVRELISAG